jgi:allantoinase
VDRQPDLVITSRRVLTPAGERPAAVVVRSGLIMAVMEIRDAPAAHQHHDAGDAVVMPGIVDVHVHSNDPGRSHWEGFGALTTAAALGGVTTVIDMPVFGSPSASTPTGMAAKFSHAEGECWTDVGFRAGLVPGGIGLAGQLEEAGAFGFFGSLVPLGIDDFDRLDAGALLAALLEVAQLRSTFVAHAELPAPIERAWAELAEEHADARSYMNYLRARPAAAEGEAVHLLLEVAERSGAAVHVTNLSSATSLAGLRRARAGGAQVTVGTAPHYLHFAAEDVPAGATEFKCIPPIRGASERDELWEALGDGTIDLIASGHSPCPPELKLRESGDFAAAWPGIAGVQLMLPVVWTGARQRGFGLRHLAEWLCTAPSALLGLERRKGALTPGSDADITIWQPESSFTVEPARLAPAHRLTPWAGAALEGVVTDVYLRGEAVVRHGQLTGRPRGRLLRKRLGRGDRSGR